MWRKKGSWLVRASLGVERSANELEKYAVVMRVRGWKW